MTSQVKTPRRTLTGIALATAAAAALALPATGLAGVAALQDDVLATAPLSQIPTRIQLVKDTNVKVTRVDIIWQLVAPTPPADPGNPNDKAYDWSRLDAIFNGLAAAGITPIVSTYGTPDWAVAGRNDPHPKTLYNPNAPTTAAFGAFMKAVATRYSGSFTPPGAGAPLSRVRHFEIWNEPNLHGFFAFNGPSSLAKYKGLVKTGFTNIKAANPKSIVIAGVGGPSSSSTKGNVGAKVWLNGLINDKRLKFDAYSQHIYPSRGPLFFTKSYARAFPTWASVPEILRTLDRKKKGMKLYITEAGYTTEATPFRTVKVSPEQQALYMKQLFNLKSVKNTQVAAVVWFNLQDNVNWPGGLLTAAGVKQPSYAVFQRLAARAIPPKLRVELAR